MCHHFKPDTVSLKVSIIQICFVFLVKEAVQKAELDAGLAAQDAMKHGHKAESRVESIKESAEPSHEGSDQTGEDKPDQPVKKHTNLGTLYMSI